MDLTDFSDGAVWAIEEGAIEHMMAAIPRVTKMENFDQAALKIKEAEAYEPELTVRDRVAIIPVSGSISKRTGFLSFLFGGASIDRIRADIDAALSDRRVAAVLLYVDSPGGRVNGVSELAEYIYKAREQKPFVAFSDGQMTSAATWIGSAANEKIISPTAQEGSIGVLTLHADFSKMDEKMGIKFTYLTAGKYKALGNDAEPLSKEAREMIEARLSETYDVFVSAMAKYRGADEETVREEMAEGRVFVGRQAVDAGLADKLGSLEDAVEAAMRLAGGQTLKSYKGVQTMNLEDIKTIDQLKEAFPQLSAQLTEQAAEDARSGVDIDAARSDAVAGERERVAGLVKVHFGEDVGAKFEPIIRNGFSVEHYQQMKDALGGSAGTGTSSENDSDKQFRQNMRDGINSASAPDVGGDGGAGEGPRTWTEAVSAIAEEKKCTRTEAMKHAAKAYPELHQAYLKEHNKQRK